MRIQEIKYPKRSEALKAYWNSEIGKSRKETMRKPISITKKEKHCKVCGKLFRPQANRQTACKTCQVWNGPMWNYVIDKLKLWYLGSSCLICNESDLHFLCSHHLIDARSYHKEDYQDPPELCLCFNHHMIFHKHNPITHDPLIPIIDIGDEVILLR